MTRPVERPAPIAVAPTPSPRPAPPPGPPVVGDPSPWPDEAYRGWSGL